MFGRGRQAWHGSGMRERALNMVLIALVGATSAFACGVPIAAYELTPTATAPRGGEAVSVSRSSAEVILAGEATAVSSLRATTAGGTPTPTTSRTPAPVVTASVVSGTPE